MRRRGQPGWDRDRRLVYDPVPTRGWPHWDGWELPDLVRRAGFERLIRPTPAIVLATRCGSPRVVAESAECRPAQLTTMVKVFVAMCHTAGCFGAFVLYLACTVKLNVPVSFFGTPLITPVLAFSFRPFGGFVIFFHL